MPWPIDEEGRNLSLYKENNFGPSKSYHVVGELNDFFGGYYHDSNYGFGHWSEYEEMPGQKLWLWALSRAGGIWEDLLTDTDGQYIEFQAGRLFVQYSPGNHSNPVTQANFEPHSSDLWREIWFPVMSIGGMTDASEKAVMNVQLKDEDLHIGINPFQDSKATIELLSRGKIIQSNEIDLDAMDVYETSFDIEGLLDYEVRVDQLDLHYNSVPGENLLERPFSSGEELTDQLSVEQIYRMGMEDVKFRLFSDGMSRFEECLIQDPNHSGSLIAIADIYYRQGQYDKGLSYIQKALRLDTYDPSANYVAGILYQGKGDKVNAKESLGWAARSLTYRSAAFAQIAGIWLSEGELSKAEKYSNKALDFNRYNLNALMVKAIVARSTGNDQKAIHILDQIIEIDPLHHFPYFEKYLITDADLDQEQFKNRHQSEFPVQTYLELAIAYYNMGRLEESIKVLDLAPKDPLVDLWWTFIKQESTSRYLSGITDQSPEFVFPFRRETLEALEWANSHYDHWKFKYYLALNLWGKGRLDEAAALMKECTDQPDYDVFYTARGHLLNEVEDIDNLDDLTNAFDLDHEDYRNWRALIAYHNEHKNYNKTFELAEKAHKKYPDNYAVGVDFTRSLIHQHNYQDAIDVLEKIHVLPFEGASEGRYLYEQSYYGRSLELIHNQNFTEAIKLLETSKMWPERLGVGKPFNPDERIADFLIGHAYSKLGKKQNAEQHFKLVTEQSISRAGRKSTSHLLGLMAMEQTGSQKEIDGYLDMLVSSDHSDSEETRWVLAKFKNENFISDKLNSESIIHEISRLID